jgi:hypothetical protein
MTYLQGNCSYRRADTVRGGRPTYAHLPTPRIGLIVDLTCVETLLSISPLPGSIPPVVTRSYPPSPRLQVEVTYQHRRQREGHALRVHRRELCVDRRHLGVAEHARHVV